MTAVEDRTELLLEIPVDEIHAHPHNPRSNAQADDEMINSIQALGILQPLIVRPADSGGWELLAGHRRLDGARQAGLATVPAVARAADDAEAFSILLVENMARRDLKPLEEAAGIQRLADLGLSQREVGARLGISQSKVSKRLALLRLPDVAKECLDSGGMSEEQAVKLTQFHPSKKDFELIIRGGKVDDWQFGQAVRRWDAEAKRAKVRAELEAAGVRLLDKQPGWNRSHAPVRLGRHYLGVDIDEAEHSVLPCHAVYVEHNGDTTVCCTDPSQHPLEQGDEKAEPTQRQSAAGGEPETYVPGHGWVADSRLTDEHRQAIADEEADKERRNQWEAAVGLRAEWAKEHIRRGPIPQRYPEVFGLTAMVLPCISDMDMGGAIGLLGIDVDEDFDTWQYGGELVQRQALTLTHGGLKVTLAVVLAAGADLLRYRNAAEGDQLAAGRAVLAYMRSNGYQLAPVEVEYLGEKLPEPEAGGDPVAEGEVELDPEAPAGPVVAVSRGPREKKWRVDCSECGEVSKQTTREYGDAAAAGHLREKHGAQ